MSRFCMLGIIYTVIYFGAKRNWVYFKLLKSIYFQYFLVAVNVLSAGWRTMLVVPELNKELRLFYETLGIRKVI
jgi:hypothetical protein